MDIDIQEFDSRLNQDESFILLDVRELIEFQTFNLGGVNIPLGKLLEDMDESNWDKQSEIVVICQRGIRSATAVKFLTMQGYSKVRNLKGGLLAWHKFKSKNLK